MTAQAVSPRVGTRRPRRAQREDVVPTTAGPWRPGVSGGVPSPGVAASARCAGPWCWLPWPSLASVSRPRRNSSVSSVQFTANSPGDIYIIGNTLISCDPKSNRWARGS